jgi:hypothetical protein
LVRTAAGRGGIEQLVGDLGGRIADQSFGVAEKV